MKVFRSYFLIATCLSLLALSVGLNSNSMGGDSDSKDVSDAAHRLAEVMSWRDSTDPFSSMTIDGLADYCVLQIHVLKKAQSYYQDPQQIPDLEKAHRILSEQGIDSSWIDSSWIDEVPSIDSVANFEANLKLRRDVFKRERLKLVVQLGSDKLRMLAERLHAQLAVLKSKPSSYGIAEIQTQNSTSQVALRLTGLHEIAAPKSGTVVKHGALYCNFVTESSAWKFVGFDWDKHYEEQLNLLRTLDLSHIHIPNEQRDTNLLDCTSRWSFARSRQSEHFIVYWAKGYGDQDPNSSSIASSYRVDVDDLLAKGEQFYQTNVERLKFADAREGKSELSKYKMMIFLLHTKDWVAAGSGCDDVVGALWVSPSACHPVGSTIAHEIGHCFQYQVYCDLKGSHGFRYGFGGGGGNGFWEQSAQWQAMQDYPKEIFGMRDFSVYLQNCHRHFHHEDQRYASYFLPFYWQQKHGPDILAKIWRDAVEPEDPIQAYMRITGITTAQLNDEIYDAASRFATWDIDALRALGAKSIGTYSFAAQKTDDGFMRVSYSRCPGTTGYNVISLSLPSKGEGVTAEFRGVENHPEFNPMPAGVKSGWRYGFVALDKEGQRLYGGMNRTASGSVTCQPPSGCRRLFFIVTGAPETYRPHAWDDNEKNDDQWPYEVKFTGASVLNIPSQ